MLKNTAPAADDPRGFVLLAALENVLRHWWIPAGLIVAGGLLGLLLFALTPPQYESVGQFSAAIDYVSTGPLTQYDEDLAINTAGNLFVSNEVLEMVITQANTEGIALQQSDLRRHFFLERRFSQWTVRVRDPDPQRALRLAEIWMAIGENTLRESYQHALQAAVLERYLRAQEGCLEKVGLDTPLDSPCNSASFAQLQRNLQQAGAALVQERAASRGLFSGLVFGPFDSPRLATGRVTAGRGQFILLGGLVGLLAGVVLTDLGAARWFSAKA